MYDMSLECTGTPPLTTKSFNPHISETFNSSELSLWRYMFHTTLNLPDMLNHKVKIPKKVTIVYIYIENVSTRKCTYSYVIQYLKYSDGDNPTNGKFH